MLVKAAQISAWVVVSVRWPKFVVADEISDHLRIAVFWALDGSGSLNPSFRFA